ncbi:MAG: CBS domain-containing protein [Nitrospirota bacterium]|nr:CBS domain-containing protein [Nitrospirota bacterium]
MPEDSGHVERCVCRKNDLKDEDFRAALVALRNHVDITEEDLLKIYELALRHVRERLVGRVPVRDVMSTNVVTVQKGIDVHDAAQLLSEHHISGMPVVTDEGAVAGVLSEDDILALMVFPRVTSFRDILRHLLGEPVRAKQNSGLVEHVLAGSHHFPGSGCSGCR